MCILVGLSMVACGELPDKGEDGKAGAYIPVPNKSSELSAEYAENIEDRYHLYYFYLGSIKKVPVYSSTAIKYSYDDTEYTFKYSSLTEESLSNTISKSEEIIDTHSYTGGFKLVFEQDIGVEMGTILKKIKANFKTQQSTDHHWTNNWGKTITESNSTTSSYVNKYSEGGEFKFSFSEKAGYKKGNYYRRTYYETVKAYGILIYDIEKDTYSTSSQTFLQANSTILEWEESENGVFEYEKGESLDFDLEKAILFAQNNPPSTLKQNGGNDMGLSETKIISVTMNRFNCKDGSSYNKNNQGKSSRHDGYEIGQLNLYGCNQIKENYKIYEAEKFAIRYKVLENTEDLPRVGTALTYISNDGATKVKGTNINSRIGYGAYWVRITYSDDEQIQYNQTNILKNATDGTIINIVTPDNLDETKKIKKIDVVVAYEIFAGAPGIWFGIWWKEYSNWRCEYTYNFI